MSETGRLVNEAREGGYAIGAFNVHNPETAQALLIAAERAGAPVILQLGGALLPHLGLEGAYEMTLRQAEQSGAVRAIHLDHGTEDEAMEAIRLGFDSVMFDGSRLPLEENIRATRRIVSVAHDFGVLVEAERWGGGPAVAGHGERVRVTEAQTRSSAETSTALRGSYCRTTSQIRACSAANCPSMVVTVRSVISSA